MWVRFWPWVPLCEIWKADERWRPLSLSLGRFCLQALWESRWGSLCPCLASRFVTVGTQWQQWPCRVRILAGYHHAVCVDGCSGGVPKPSLECAHVPFQRPGKHPPPHYAGVVTVFCPEHWFLQFQVTIDYCGFEKHDWKAERLGVRINIGKLK